MVNLFKRLGTAAVAVFFGLSVLSAQNTAKPWTPVDFEVLSGNTRFETRPYGNPFTGSIRSILRLAPELNGLEGVRLPLNGGEMRSNTVTLKFNRNVKLLIGVAPVEGREGTTQQEVAALYRFGSGSVTGPVLSRAVNVTEMPALDVYAVDYRKGEHTISIAEGEGRLVILGAVPSGQKMVHRDLELEDETDYEAFHIEEYYDGRPLFTVIGGNDEPVVEEGMPGTETIQGGFEGGAMVKINGVYHMFPTERAGEIGMPAYFDRVKTRIGHWTSTDAITWTRQSTILQSSGTYAIVPEDNPMNDRRSAIWSYMPIFSEENNRWYGHYLAYTTDFNISPNHSFGRIWRCESEVEGIEGIGGPYRDIGIVIEPGWDSQLWEGRQGVASFFPYKVADGWLGFYSGAFPFETKAHYPDRGGRGWFVGLAKSDNLEGPWTRLDETVNPVTSIHPWFVENPIVSQLPNGLYIAVFDGGPEWLKLPNMIAYTLSKDGYNWTRARYIPIDKVVKKWWDTMRTPLGLIPEGDDVYTIIYAAIDNDRRYHPMGRVQVKLDREVLDEIAAGL